MSVANVADASALLGYTHINHGRKNSQRIAISKAYTCALSSQNSNDYASGMKVQRRSVADIGDLSLAAIQGRAVLLHPSTRPILAASASADQEIRKTRTS